MYNFMRRKMLKTVNLHGQEAEPDPEEVEKWLTETIPDIEARYSADCRYNTDEFPFCWQKLPKRSVVLKRRFLCIL